METELLALLKDAKYQPKKAIELAVYFGIEKSELEDFYALLFKLEKERKIFRSRQDRYGLPESFGFKVGRLKLNKKGFGFIEDELGEEVYVRAMDLHGAMNLDIVYFSVKRQHGTRVEAVVQQVIERGVTRIVGEVKRSNVLIPDDAKILNPITIKKNQLGLVAGHKVVANIVDYGRTGNLIVDVIKIIGHKNDPGVDIQSIVENLQIKSQFDDATLEQAAQIDETIVMEGRRDLTDSLLITVDGATAKDLDDAISLEKLDNNRFKVGVYIADVSHYVTPQSPLDDEAFLRGTSVYLVDRVIPMLPHRLSNGICSLNPNVNRYAIGCEFVLDEQGKVESYDIFPAVIQSKERMTYEEINQMLDGDDILRENYSHLLEMIDGLVIVRDRLEKMRQRRGEIEFDIKEAKVIVNELGVPTEIVPRIQGESERIIESLMIAANEVVASHIHHMDLPFIYRIHEAPKIKRLRQFAGVASILGYRIKKQVESIQPKDLQQLLDKVKGKKEEPLLATLMLRSMQRAVYSDQCQGHYGLASTDYTHFTSPIRRYPDLMVHRLLRTYLFEHKLDEHTIQYYQDYLPDVASQSSTQEYQATVAERDVLDLKKAEYMEQFVGSKFKGIISSVTTFGMFVALDNTIEGLVHVSSMKDDHYIFDERHLSYVGRRTKKAYRMGDEVEVKLVGVQVSEGMIDFELTANRQANRPRKNYPRR